MHHNLSHPAVITRLAVIYGLTILGLAAYVWHITTGAMPDRIAFNPLALYNIYWYGFMLLAAILLGGWVAGGIPVLDSDKSITFGHYPVALTIVGLCFARLFDVLFVTPLAQSQGITSAADYFNNPTLLFDLSWGGLNVWGAIWGVGILLVLLAAWHSKAISQTLFKSMIALLIISSLAQWGHFLNQELYGYPTQSILGIFIHPEFRLPGFATADRFTPIFLVAALWHLVGGSWLIIDPRWYPTERTLWDGFLVGAVWFVVGRLFFELATPYSLFNWLPASLFLLLIIVLAFRQHLKKNQ